MDWRTKSLKDYVRDLGPACKPYFDLVDEIGAASIVMIGEASHGTHEFYRDRAYLTRLLIENKGFNAVAVEADWPDAYRVNRYVQGSGSDATPEQALGDFMRFPQWMWRNLDVVNFAAWLHEHNKQIQAVEQRIGFYGVDLYSLYSSIESVIAYLDQTDPDAARRARERYECFDHFNRDSQAYGMQATMGLRPDCEDEVVEQLMDLRRSADDYLRKDGVVARDELFDAEQNARVVTNAEQYYRSMFLGRDNSWNIRDRHMAETIEMLARHLRDDGQVPRIVVWAHNSHLGDARATDQSARGELNLGQLLRQAHGDDCVAIGFSTYTGTVTAASNWDSPAEHKRVRPGLPGSYEELFHQVGVPNFMVRTADAAELKRPRLQRAIGVIYRPETERQSHYYQVQLRDQFDWMIHYDRTRAVEPLEKGPAWKRGVEEDVPEAYPSGL